MMTAELSTWASYSPKTPPVPARTEVKPTEVKSKKKIGRNDPCPCGSGKKYKKCCLSKGITFKEETSDDKPDDLMEDFMGHGELYNDSKPYNLLHRYPGLDPEVREGEYKFAEFFSPRGIEIDVPVYKALHHRSIPMWIERNHEKEDRERIDLLLEAFALFTQTCANDSIDSFDAFDEKYMVHYHAVEWISRLQDLLEKYEGAVPQEQYAMLENVTQTLERMGTP
ncbi:MAG: SEC-C domain-containing protein [Treponema sp.]|jgi:hypothetical protein|nr:SEC-C domain-containing protein [Treponema sp.]